MFASIEEGSVIPVFPAIVSNYITKDILCIEWNGKNSSSPRRIHLYMAVIEILRITKDCTEIEKDLIMNTVKRKKNMIRKLCKECGSIIDIIGRLEDKHE